MAAVEVEDTWDVIRDSRRHVGERICERGKEKKKGGRHS